MGTSKAIDWERVEGDYRAGQLSLREIGSLHGLTEGAIRKRAKRDDWTRDLEAKVRAKAEDLVRKQAVREAVRNEAKVTERVLIDANAQVIAQVRSDHRTDIGRYRTLALKLLRELEHQTDSGDLYEQLFELLTDPEGEDADQSAAAKERQRKRREVFERALSLGGRTKTMKDLADTLKTLIALEREAYGLALGAVESQSRSDLLQEISGLLQN